MRASESTVGVDDSTGSERELIVVVRCNAIKNLEEHYTENEEMINLAKQRKRKKTQHRHTHFYISVLLRDIIERSVQSG